MTNRYSEPQALNEVAEFHNIYDLPITDEPNVPSTERCTLRVNLIQEELNELKEAIEQKDIVEVADALCDLQYVLSGAILEFGLADKFSDLFDEVHRSNMSKVCKSVDEADVTQELYAREKDTSSYVRERNGEYLVFREEDGKVLKSVNYSPADLARYL